MKCFEYPLDTGYLLRKKRAIKRELRAQGTANLHKKIAVLGGSTTNEVVDQLEMFLLNYGIEAEFYQSEYNQYWQDAMFGSEELDAFAPDVIYIHTGFRNITEFPTTASTKQEVEEMLQAQYQHFEVMWEKLSEKFRCPIIQNNFERPNYRLLGNKDISDYRGRTNFISRLNQKLYEYAQNHENFYVNDLDYLASDYGYAQWQDGFYWHMYKYALCLDAIPYLAKSLADIIKSLYGRNKKAFSLDLDNTLWGGVVGDDGVEGIAIGPEVSLGQVYEEFQNYLKAHKQIGVLLTVNSKNEMENAMAGLKHPDGPLKPEDFVAIKANWENKDRNLIETAAELSLGADSFVFVDDNPAERAIVEANVPGVSVPVMERAEQYIRTLDHGGYFEVTTLSKDDLARNEMYKANAQRAVQMASFTDYGEYLDSLEMQATVRPFEPIYYPRISQLTNKSNQFNLTTRRCSEADIQNMQENPDWLCLYGKLADKFGDNGLVSVVAGEQQQTELHLRLWLMSCRVLKRGMEDAMLDCLVSDAKARGLTALIGYYYPTAKNGMVRDFYERMGFTRVSLVEDGSSVWRCEVADYQPKHPHMTITR